MLGSSRDSAGLSPSDDAGGGPALLTTVKVVSVLLGITTTLLATIQALSCPCGHYTVRYNSVHQVDRKTGPGRQGAISKSVTGSATLSLSWAPRVPAAWDGRGSAGRVSGEVALVPARRELGQADEGVDVEVLAEEVL